MLNTGRSLFSKQERMVSRQLIETLFSGGSSHSLAAFPLRVVYMVREREEGDVPVQLLISVPKKHFKHAVDRNRVKRQIRESYRRHKELLTGSLPDNQQLLMACEWLSDCHEASSSIEQKLVSLMRRIGEKL
jgi:ribonuclease P protein component